MAAPLQRQAHVQVPSRGSVAADILHFYSARGRDEHAPRGRDQITQQSCRALHCGAVATFLDQSESSWRLRCNGKHLKAPACGDKHSPLKCLRPGRARTLDVPASRTMKHPQACSISRRLHGGSTTAQASTCAGA